MTLELYRIPASAGYDTVIAMLNAKNTGTGLAETGTVEWILRVISPYADDEIDRLIQTFDAAHDREFPWREITRASNAASLLRAAADHNAFIDATRPGYDRAPAS